MQHHFNSMKNRQKISSLDRNAAIDFLRAASMIYIVGFWHLMNYTDPILKYNTHLTNRITEVALGLFVMISGYLLGRKKFSINLNSLINFYKTRIIRIYPLYLIALTLFLSFNLINFKGFIKSILLLCLVWKPSIPTLWFISMIMFFYLIAPFLISSDNRQFILLSILFVLLILLWGKLTYNRLDYRIIFYFPSFAMGILLARKPKNFPSTPLIIFLCLLCILFFSFTLIDFENESLKTLARIPFLCSAAFTIFIIADHSFKKHYYGKIWVQRISYASYAMFLFHRPVYITLKSLYFPPDVFGQVLYLAVIGAPLILILSIFAQKTADRIFSKTF